MSYRLTGNRKTGYGIKIVEFMAHRVCSVEAVNHVSQSKAEAVQMLRRFAEERLFPVHLQDAVDDCRCAERTERDVSSEARRIA